MDKISLSVSHQFTDKQVKPDVLAQLRRRALAKQAAGEICKRTKKFYTESDCDSIPFAFNWTNVQYTLNELYEHIAAGNAFCVARLQGKHRIGREFESAQLIGVDLDRGAAISSLMQNDFVAGYASMLYPSASDSPELHKTRVLFLLDKPITDEKEYRDLVCRVLGKFADFGAMVDSQCKDSVRLFFGSTKAPGNSIITAHILPVDVIKKLPLPVKTRPPEWYANKGIENARLMIQRSTNGHKHEELRNASILLGGYVGGGLLVESEAIRVLEAEIDCKADVEDLAGAYSTIRDGIVYGKGRPFTLAELEAQRQNYLGVNGYTVPTLSSNGHSSAPAASQLPRIQVNARPLRVVSNETLAALLKRNVPPIVFVRAAVLTRVLVDENGQPGAEAMSVAAVKGELERAADFFRRKITSDGEVQDTSTSLPQDYVKDIMALPQWVGIPPLAGIVTAPTFAADKSLCIEPGYHAATGLYYHQNGLVLGDTLPTPKNVAEAKELINDLLADFPFVGDASKAHAVAILLLPFVRPMIAGATPLHLIDAPTEGTGKGLLADVLTIPFAPNGPALMTAAKSEEEWGKRITAILTTAKSHILIDNITGKFDSAVVAAAITAPFWSDRVLGTNDRIVTLPVKNVWLATANNPSLSAELASRTVRIRLDAKVERPRHQRTGFRHERLREWARENRSRLATAALVLVRNWIEQLAVAGKMQMGSFEDYAAVIGGILDAAEIPGFLGNVVEMYDDLDAERNVWVSFCEQWFTTYDNKPVGIAELFPLASAYDLQPGGVSPSGHDLLSEYLGSGNERSRKTLLGTLLTQHIDRVYGPYRIVQAKEKKHAKQYKLDKR